MPVSESTFGRLQELRKGVPRAFGTDFGFFYEVLGIAKTCDSVQYTLQKIVFQRSPVPRRLSMARSKRFGAYVTQWGVSGSCKRISGSGCDAVRCERQF